MGIFSCSHQSCVDARNPRAIYFESRQAWERHNAYFHPETPPPLTRALSGDTAAEDQEPTPFASPFLYNRGRGATLHDPMTLMATDICRQYLAPVGQPFERVAWAGGLTFIASVYTHQPPDFRSTWRTFLRNNNKRIFLEIMSDILRSILAASHGWTPDADAPGGRASPAPFWWLLFHLEMLILAPTAKTDRVASIQETIQRRLGDFRAGRIQLLFDEAMRVASWRPATTQAKRGANRAAQQKADADNMRSATRLVCQDDTRATIGNNNVAGLRKLYIEPVPDLGHSPAPAMAAQRHALPGDITRSIRRGAKCRGTGVNADSIDAFIDLANLEVEAVDNDIRAVFDLVYNNLVPAAIRPYFTDTFLFCFYKDPEDKTKLRPTGIPSAMRRVIALHVASYNKLQFARHLWPFNLANGIDGGMNFIVKSTPVGNRAVHSSASDDRQLVTITSSCFLEY